MKHVFRTPQIACALALLCLTVPVKAATPYFNIRSQSANDARVLAGWSNYINRYGAEDKYKVWAITPEYTSSFRADDIARCIFGDSITNCNSCPTLTISGSGVANRGAKDWLADYFGLPTDYKSSIAFNPRIKNFLIDFDFFIGLDNCKEGLYFRVHGPFVNTRWDLNFCETVSQKGTANHPQGYFNATTVDRSNLLNSFEEFVSERKVPNLGTDVAFAPLEFARWANCSCAPLKLNGFADLRFTLGWNAFLHENHHIGFGIHVAAPTGNRPRGKFLFEPMIGNGNHWELGGQFTGSWKFWQSDDEERHAGVYADLNLTHLFNTRQVRTFDLKNKPNSRYALAMKLGTSVFDSGFVRNATPNLGEVFNSEAVFKNLFTPVANLTTSYVKTTIGIQSDFVLMFNYTHNNMVFDLGYNLWGRSCERFRLICECPSLLRGGQTWALKGDAHVFGFTATDVGNDPEDTPIPLGGTQSRATINKGNNLGMTNPTRNPGVDVPKFAAMNFAAGNSTLNATTGGGADTTRTSEVPQFLSEADIDLAGASTRSLSHKIFANFSWQWLNNDARTPFLGIGVEAEFASTDCPTTDQCADNCSLSCRRCGISQWGVWIKGGISYN